MDTMLVTVFVISTFTLLRTSASTVELIRSSTNDIKANNSISFECRSTYEMVFVRFYDETISLTASPVVILRNASGSCTTFGSPLAGYAYTCNSVTGPYILSINPLSENHDGSTVRCAVQHGSSSDIAIANYVIEFTQDSSNGSNDKLTIGLGVGIPLFLIVLIILIVFIVWKSKRTEDKAPNAVQTSTELHGSHRQTDIIEKDAKIYLEQAGAILLKIKNDGKYTMPPEAKRQIITLLREYSKNASVDAPQQKIQSSLVVRIQLVAKRMKNENFSTRVEVGDRNVRSVVNSLVFILEMLNIKTVEESEINHAITLAEKDQRVLRYMSENSNQMGIDDVVSKVLKIIDEIQPAVFMSVIIDLFPGTSETHLITLSTVVVALSSDKIFRQNILKVIRENIWEKE